MRKFIATVVMLALPFVVVPAAVSAGVMDAWQTRPRPRPHPYPRPVEARQLAKACVLKGMSAGAFETMDSDVLAGYCIDVSKRVMFADYRPDDGDDDDDNDDGE